MARFHLIYLDIDTGYSEAVSHGVASLAGAVRSRGHFLSFQHLRSHDPAESVVKEAQKQSPEVVGFSFTSPQKRYVPEYARALQDALGVPLIAGGLHPSIAPQEVMDLGFFAGVCLGEAEFSLPELLSAWEQGGNPSAVPGFWWKSDDGRVIRNPVPPLETDLSKLPLPDYSIFDTTGIGEAASGWIGLVVSRGCPYYCTYCCNHVLRNLYPNKADYVRIPPAYHAIKFIKHAIKSYPEVNGINFSDDLLIVNEKWFVNFAQLYKKEINLPYTSNGRVENISDILIEALRECGCCMMHIGIESGDEWVRRYLLNRKQSNQEIEKACAKLKAAGIPISTYNIVGFPFETKQQMLETLRINRRIQPQTGMVFYFYPFPGTKLFKLCQEYNLLLPDEEMSQSGYIEQPSIRPVHWSNPAVVKIYQKIRLYLAAQSLISSLRLPVLMGNLTYWLLNLYPSFFVRIITKRSRLKYLIRKWLYRFIYRKV